MSSRVCCLALFALVLAAQAGCCCCDDDCWPHGKSWCGPQCGQFYWNEWFSHPPECCDPCDDCGNYCGEGTPGLYYRGYEPPGSMNGGGQYGDGGQYDGGGYTEGNAPSDGQGLRDYYAPEEITGESSPPLAEPIPPGQPSAAAFFDEFGDAVSYQEPVASRRQTRKLGHSRGANYQSR